MASLIELCNRALANIAKGEIASLNEASPEAKQCVRFAQPLLDEMIAWSDQMPLGRRRVALAELPNDRPSEWLHAYAKPSDMGTPLAIRRQADDAHFLPEGGPYNFPTQEGQGLRFLLEGGKIYSNVETATLIYTAASLQAAELGALMQEAFVNELAVRISMPLTKDPKVKQALIPLARESRAAAIAHEENKMTQRQVAYTSEAELARLGLL
ncbi:hypothetical protein [Novosphingobium soli]|uniref:Uncharacterized protein n=1 Tax=Novosphingobium soli TaxID=574956 RepID=A0ABV6CVI0_9SPHN